MKLIFPTAIILLNVGAALCYCDYWRKVVFYGAAAAINFVMAY